MANFAWPINELSAYAVRRNGNATLTLGSDATGGPNRTYIVAHNYATVGNDVTLAFISDKGSLKINGKDNVSLAPGQSAAFAFDGTDWNLAITPTRQNHFLLKSVNYTVIKADLFNGNIIGINAGSPVITMPSAGSVNGGDYVTVKNFGAGTVTVATSGGQTIDGAASLSLGPNNSAVLVSMGTGWIVT